MTSSQIFQTKHATAKMIHLVRYTLARAKIKARVMARRSAHTARSITSVESTGVSSNIHTCEMNTRGKWRKGRRLKLRIRRTTKTKTMTPGSRHQAMLLGPLKQQVSATRSTLKLVKRFTV
jgi:hypothetical protein